MARNKAPFHFFLCKNQIFFTILDKKKIKKAGFLKYGNSRFPFFIYNDYKIVTLENIRMMHTMKYLYKCKFDEIKTNLAHYKAGLMHLSSMCHSMSEHRSHLKGIKKFRECLMTKENRDFQGGGAVVKEKSYC